jgi:hypothetical protein
MTTVHKVGAIAGALALTVIGTACTSTPASSSTTTTTTSSSPLPTTTSVRAAVGVVTGTAAACIGPLPPVPPAAIHVTIRLYAGVNGGGRPVASERVVAGTKYGFSVAPGPYEVVDAGLGQHSVSVRAGGVVTANFVDLCS